MGILNFPMTSKPEFGVPMKVEEGIFLLEDAYPVCIRPYQSLVIT